MKILHASWNLAIGCLIIGLLGGPASGAFAAGLYKWTDENGDVHYTDKPPPDAEVETITVNTKRDEHTAQRMRNIQKQIQANESARAQSDQTEAREEAEATKLAQHCEASKRKLADLQGRPRRQVINEKGEREYLDDAQRQAWIRTAQAEIAKHCQ